MATLRCFYCICCFYFQKHNFNQLCWTMSTQFPSDLLLWQNTSFSFNVTSTLIPHIVLKNQWHRLEDHIVHSEMFLYNRHICPCVIEICKGVNVMGITCWLGGVVWGVCPVGGACPPLLSTTGMLGDVVLWWGLNESCQSTAFLFNTHTLLIPPQPVGSEIHLNQYVEQTKCLISSDPNLLFQNGDLKLSCQFISYTYLKLMCCR